MKPAAAVAASAALLALSWLALGTEAAPDLRESGARDWSGDFRSYYLPNAEYLGARLARGELPLWNPQQAAGIPFLATLQVGALYPPNWLHALLPAPSAFLVLAVLHLMLAAVLTGALAQALGAGAAGSALAALAYGGSVQIVGAVWSPPVLYAAAWAPGLFLAVERATARPGARSAVGLAAVLALCVLSGWPYVLAITALGAALYAAPLLVAATLRQRRPPAAALAALTAGVLAGVVLAGPQLAASLELLAHSVRALGSLVEAQAIGGGVSRPHQPSAFLELLTARGYNDGVPGWPCLILAALAVILPGPARGRALALLAAGAVGLLASFPESTPVFAWLRELPVYADFRFPFRYRLLPTLALAVAAGVGLGQLQRALAPRPRLSRGIALGALALELGTVTLPTLTQLPPFARSWPAPVGFAAELAAGSGVALGPAPGRVYWAGRAERLRSPGDLRVIHDLEPLSLARSAELLTYFETGRPRTLLTLPASDAPGRDAVAPPFFGKLVLPDAGARAAILDLFSVGTVVAAQPPGWLASRYQRRSADSAELAVFANPGALPRAYRVARALPEPGALAAGLRTLTAPDFDPTRLVLLDAPPPLLLAGRGESPPALRPVAIELDAPEQIRLRSDGPEPGVVVLSDAYYPGWEASVDGAPAPLLRANLGFRGVAVPAGSHLVELRYRPAWLPAAGAAALATALLCIALAWRLGRAGGGDGHSSARPSHAPDAEV